MIGQLKGMVEQISGGVVLLDVQGVGYEVTCSAFTVEKLSLQAQATLIIYTDVREDSIRLYGFSDTLEKQVFLLLNEVTGIGPKTASDILSKVERRDLLRSIAHGDVSSLQSIKGVGKKTAERIIVELRDKVGQLVIERAPLIVRTLTSKSSPYDDAVEALQALGFQRKDAERAVKSATDQIPHAIVEPGEIVRQALRFV